MTGGVRSGTTHGTGANWQANLAMPWMSDAACAEVDPDVLMALGTQSERAA